MYYFIRFLLYKTLNPSQNLTYLLIHFIASTQQSSRPALSRPINLIRTLHRRAYRITLRRSSRTIASSRLPDISLISSNYMAIRSFHYVYETLNLLANRCSIGLKHRLVGRLEKVTLPDNYLRKDYEQRRECSFNYYVVTSNTTTTLHCVRTSGERPPRQLSLTLTYE